MTNMNTITVIGNLVADPEVRSFSGTNLTKLRIASNERVRNANGEWTDGDTTYADISCWRRLADGAATLKKGQKIIVYGRLKGRSFQRQDGSNGYAYEIEASEIGTSVLTKDTKPIQNNVRPIMSEDNPW